MSDQYVKLEEERRHKQKLEKDKKKKKQKKEKRGKHHRHNSLHTESEEDIAPAHHVDIITEEMPEVSCGGCCSECICVLCCFSPELPSGRYCCRSRALTACKAVGLIEMVPGCSLQEKKLFSFCAQKDQNCH